MKKNTENQKNESTERRDFLKKKFILFRWDIGITLPKYICGGEKAWDEASQSLSPSSYPPSEKVNLACIGIGHRGGQIINDLYNTGLANIVAPMRRRYGWRTHREGF